MRVLLSVGRCAEQRQPTLKGAPFYNAISPAMLWRQNKSYAAAVLLLAYFPSDTEQWFAADSQVPESFTQVSLQITDRARCVPLNVASYVNL